MSEDLRT